MGLSIKNKLFAGFGTVILLIFLSTAINYDELDSIQSSQSEVIDVRYPVMTAGRDLVNGINSSMSALRGYMILGADATEASRFTRQRKAAWEDINRATAFLQQQSSHFDGQSTATLSQIRQALTDLADSQQAIENIAQTPENQPALELLLREAGPKADLMLEQLGMMIEIEGELDADEERKALLKQLADSRGSFAISVGGLRAYLITGEQVFKDQFDHNWNINTDAYLEIDESIELLTEEQLQHWQQYEAARELFAPISIEMFRLRVSEKWNIANHMLEKDVEPKILAITKLLDQMTGSQRQQVVETVEVLNDNLASVYTYMVVVALVIMFIGAAVAVGVARNVSESMKLLVGQANELSEGNFAEDHSGSRMLQAKDEMGDLARNFERMTLSLNTMILRCQRPRCADAYCDLSSGVAV